MAAHSKNKTRFLEKMVQGISPSTSDEEQMDITTHHFAERAISPAKGRNYTPVSVANGPYCSTSSRVGQLYQSGNCQDQKWHTETSRSNTVSSANGGSKLVGVESGFFQGGRYVAFEFSQREVTRRGKVATAPRVNSVCATPQRIA